MNYARYGIIGAMPEEVEALRNIMTDVMEENIGRKVFYTGLIAGKSVVLTCSGIGKVSAATAHTPPNTISAFEKRHASRKLLTAEISTVPTKTPRTIRRMRVGVS